MPVQTRCPGAGLRRRCRGGGAGGRCTSSPPSSPWCAPAPSWSSTWRGPAPSSTPTPSTSARPSRPPSWTPSWPRCRPTPSLCPVGGTRKHQPSSPTFPRTKAQYSRRMKTVQLRRKVPLVERVSRAPSLPAVTSVASVTKHFPRNLTWRSTCCSTWPRSRGHVTNVMRPSNFQTSCGDTRPDVARVW